MTVAEYRSELEQFRVAQESVDRPRFEAHLPLLRRLDNVDRSSVAVFDMSSMSYVFLTERFHFLAGLSVEMARERGMAYFLERIHPGDLPLLFETTISCFRFLSGLSASERTEYKTSVDFRIRRGDDLWIRMIQQIVVLELNREGAIWLVLIVNDLAPLKDLEVPSRRYMTHMPSGRRVLFPAADAEADSPLTPRELEVLGLVSRGYASREIADYLGISVSTVNNHRQRILSKTDSANTAEAISYAKGLNLLDDGATADEQPGPGGSK